MDKKTILVSACLLGENCKYNGLNNYQEKYADLKDKYNVITFCPEVMGGLGVPREPLEYVGGKLIDKDGNDYQKYLDLGRIGVNELLDRYDFAFAILKAKSPSCGKDVIYDGTFSHTTVKGDGFACELLKKKGIKVYSELEKIDF